MDAARPPEINAATKAQTASEMTAIASASGSLSSWLQISCHPVSPRCDQLFVAISEPDLKVLYMTGFSDYLFKEKVVLWEGEALLDKPFSVNGLLQAASLLLTGRVNASDSPM